MSAKDWLLTHVLIDAVVNYGTVRTVPTRSRRDSTLAAAISKAIDDYKRAEASVDAGLKTPD